MTQTKRRNILLIALSSIMAFILLITSGGIFSAKADTTSYPDTSKSENLCGTSAYTGTLAGENGLYYEFALTVGNSGESQLYKLYDGLGGSAVNLIYNNPEKDTTGIGASIKGVGLVCGVTPILQESCVMFDYWVNDDETKIIVFIPTGLNFDSQGCLTDNDPYCTSNNLMFDSTNVLSNASLLGIYETIKFEENNDKDSNNSFIDLFKENSILRVSFTIVGAVGLVLVVKFVFFRRKRRR